ncbi:hypothetical protein [Nocardia farcinica]|uniref:hypothetical protein n=1 Tax=Nocardia farcinica TaxID=37329 RepID=UPI0024549E33|nr:hypothetical protein [Nocardia farcinica]
MSITKEDFDSVAEAYRSHVDEWKQIPDRINDTFDKLKVLSFGMWLATTGDRDEAQAELQKLFDKFEEIGEGIEAPYLFIGYAADWQSVAGTIRGANNVQARPEYILDGHWTGKAQQRYAASRAAQEKAMTTTDQMCEKVHEQLLKVAESGRALYKSIVDALGTYITEVGSALTQILAVITALEGAGLLIDAVFNALNEANKIYTQAYNDIQGHIIAANELINLTDNPLGLPDDRWPNSVATTFSNPGDWKLAE